jgi:hypothetical protein
MGTEFLLSHSSHKNKDVARVGHPVFCFPLFGCRGDREGLGTRFPVTVKTVEYYRDLK